MKLKCAILLTILLSMFHANAQKFFSGNIQYNVTSSVSPYTVEVIGHSNPIIANIPDTVSYLNTTYTITSIAGFTFYNTSSLTRIRLPRNLVSIGELAFYYCSNLDSVVLPPSVKTLRRAAFAGCSKLTSFLMNDSVKTIEGQVFEKCSSLRSIRLPEGLQAINSWLFYECYDLKEINIPTTVTAIYMEAFDGVPIRSINLPAGLLSIGDNAFQHTLLDSLILPNKLTSIGNNAFSSCRSLKKVILPASLKSIGSSTFAQCDSLTKIDLPSSITSISGSLFSGCIKLKSVILPEGIKRIENSMFSNCTALDSIVMPSSVTTIGSSAFNNCTSLTSINLPANLTTIEESAFMRSGLKAVAFPNSLTSIGTWAFTLCSSLSEITLPPSLKTISYHCFSNCTGLKTIRIPAGVTSISGEAFKSCSAIRTIICHAVTPPTMEEADANFPEDFAFYEIPRKTVITVPAGSEATYQTALGWRLYPNKYPLNSVESIDGFRYALSLKATEQIAELTAGETEYKGEVSIPAKIQFKSSTYRVTGVSQRAFEACKSLKAIILPDSVAFLGNYAFQGCDSLNTAVLGKNLTNIGQSTFESCTQLTTVCLPENLRSIEKRAFYYCTKLVNCPFPASLVSIGSASFYLNAQLKSIFLGDSIQSIGDEAFSNCYKLSSIVSQAKKPPLLGTGAFYGVNRNLALNIPFEGKSAYSQAAQWSEFTCVYAYQSMFENQSLMYGITSDVEPKTVELISGKAEYAGNLNVPTSINAYNVTQIQKNLFTNNKSLLSITLGDSIRLIRDSAFYGCSILNKITLGCCLDSIGINAFGGCSTLKLIQCASTTPPLLGDNAFRSINSSVILQLWAPVIHDYVKTNGWKTFSNIQPIGNPIQINQIWFTKERNATSTNLIFSGKSQGFSGLVIIPDNTTYQNTAYSITGIDGFVFRGETTLLSVKIPASIVNIGDEAFSDCSGLDTIICYAIDPPILGKNVFQNVKPNATLCIPINSINKYMLANQWKSFRIMALSSDNMKNNPLIRISGNTIYFNGLAEGATFVMYYLNGKQIFSKQVGDSIHELRLNSIPTGIYILTIQNKDGQAIHTQKVRFI